MTVKLARQFLLLCVICLVAIWGQEICPFPMPSSVLAMLMVLGLLLCGALKPRHLEDITQGLQSYMSFFFVPTCVGILEQGDIIRESGLQILLLCVVGTALTFGVTAWVTTALIRLTQGKGGEAL